MRHAAPLAAAIALLALAGCGADVAVDCPPTATSLLIETSVGIGVATGLPASDPEGARLTWELITAPAHGSLTLWAGTGDFVYVPDPGFAGSDWFAWRVHDGVQWSEIAYVTVHVAEPPIVIVVG